MDKKQADAMLKDLTAAAHAVAEKYGMQARPAGGRFDTVSLKAKIEFLSSDPTESPERLKWAEEYRACCQYNLDGLKLEWLDAEFAGNDGRRFVVLGKNARARKLPIMAADAKDPARVYKFSLLAIQRAFGAFPQSKKSKGLKKFPPPKS